jgi:hypothetical protein
MWEVTIANEQQEPPSGGCKAASRVAINLRKLPLIPLVIEAIHLTEAQRGSEPGISR